MLTCVAVIVETTLFVSRFHFLRVRSRISVVRVIILPGVKILKVRSRISDWSQFRFSFLTFYVAHSRITHENNRQIKKRDNCLISTRKDKTEEIRTKTKWKQPACNAKLGQWKSFPLSLLCSSCKGSKIF